LLNKISSIGARRLYWVVPDGSFTLVDRHDDARRLIRSDYREVALFKRLKPELMRGFSAPEEAYSPLTAAE